MSYLFNVGNKSNEDQNILWDRQNIVGVKLVCDTFFNFYFTYDGEQLESESDR